VLFFKAYRSRIITSLVSTDLAGITSSCSL
jgi:hypothetical protein